MVAMDVDSGGYISSTFETGSRVFGNSQADARQSEQGAKPIHSDRSGGITTSLAYELRLCGTAAHPAR
jgi:hypothetical protein